MQGLRRHIHGTSAYSASRVSACRNARAARRPSSRSNAAVDQLGDRPPSLDSPARARGRSVSPATAATSAAARASSESSRRADQDGVAHRVGQRHVPVAGELEPARPGCTAPLTRSARRELLDEEGEALRPVVDRAGERAARARGERAAPAARRSRRGRAGAARARRGGPRGAARCAGGGRCGRAGARRSGRRRSPAAARPERSASAARSSSVASSDHCRSSRTTQRVAVRSDRARARSGAPRTASAGRPPGPARRARAAAARGGRAAGRTSSRPPGLRAQVAAQGRDHRAVGRACRRCSPPRAGRSGRGSGREHSSARRVLPTPASPLISRIEPCPGAPVAGRRRDARAPAVRPMSPRHVLTSKYGMPAVEVRQSGGCPRAGVRIRSQYANQPGPRRPKRSPPMDLYVIVRRNGFTSAEDLKAAAKRSTVEGDKPGSGVRWIRSYVVTRAGRRGRHVLRLRGRQPRGDPRARGRRRPPRRRDHPGRRHRHRPAGSGRRGGLTPYRTLAVAPLAAAGARE